MSLHQAELVKKKYQVGDIITYGWNEDFEILHLFDDGYAKFKAVRGTRSGQMFLRDSGLLALTAKIIHRPVRTLEYKFNNFTE